MGGRASGTAETERGEERLHDYGRTRNDESADDRQLARVSVAATNREATTNDADGAEDETDEHDDAHCLACALRQTARCLSEDRREAQ